MIQELTLKANRERQAAITTEILEVVGGYRSAEVVGDRLTSPDLTELASCLRQEIVELTQRLVDFG